MGVLFRYMTSGLALGALYSLIVTGLNLQMLILNVVNFAYGPIVVLGMYAAQMAMAATNQSFALGTVAAVATTTIILLLTAPLFRPLSKRKAVLETIVVSLGISMIINEVTAAYLNNGEPVSFPPEMLGRNFKISLGITSFTLSDVYTILGAILVVLILVLFMYRTMLGRSFRAMAQDPAAAKVFGIPLDRNGIYGFAVTGLLAGLTAMLAAVLLGSAGPKLGGNLAVAPLTIAFLAGAGDFKGGLICSLGVGVLEAMVLGYLPGRWTEAIVYSTIMVLIIIKPHGLFGTRV
jgi:branched-chain amino acid transport system permease protein